MSSFFVGVNYFSDLPRVLMPKGKYKGQKLINEVATNTPPRTRRIIPIVPVTVPVKYNTPNTIATRMRTILSMEPMFAFIAAFVLVQLVCFELCCLFGLTNLH